MGKVNHQLLEKDFFIPNWEVRHLFLGTFNPEGGEKVRYFYGRNKNQTWPNLANIFKDDRMLPNSKDSEFFTSLKFHGIACMDLIKCVEFNELQREFIIGRGYSDSKIINNQVSREYLIDDIINVIKKNNGCMVYSTWGQGSNLKEWRLKVDRITQISNIVQLVSPSLVARVPEGERKKEYIKGDWESKIKK